MKRRFLLIILVLMLVFSAGCAPGPNPQEDRPNEEGELAGFWGGLWHGFITPFTFVVSLFSQDVRIYQVHNNGAWYNFGYLLGLTMIFGGGGGAAKRSKR